MKFNKESKEAITVKALLIQRGIRQMPMDRNLYPANWEVIALHIKEAANWRCQECDRPCRRKGESLLKFIERIQGCNHPSMDWVNQIAVSTICSHPQKFTLTVSHLNHIPSDCSLENLKALCAPCHCRYDLKTMGLKRRLRREREGQLTLEVD